MKIPASGAVIPKHEQTGDYYKRLQLWISFWKFVLGTFLVSVLTAVLNHQIQVHKEEMDVIDHNREYVKNFLANALDDNLEKRLSFAEYFSDLLGGEWTKYYEHLKQDRIDQNLQIEKAKAEQQKLATSQDPRDQERIQTLTRRIEALEINLVPRFHKIVPYFPPNYKTRTDWPFVVMMDGDDLIVYNVRAALFGLNMDGTYDVLDDGLTLSNVNNRDPHLIGCGLPMYLGSPLPKLPWNTVVQVTNLDTAKSTNTLLVDLGPQKSSGFGIKLTKAAMEAIGAPGDAMVNYRIINGRKLLNKN